MWNSYFNRICMQNDELRLQIALYFVFICEYKEQIDWYCWLLLNWVIELPKKLCAYANCSPILMVWRHFGYSTSIQKL